MGADSLPAFSRGLLGEALGTTGLGMPDVPVAEQQVLQFIREDGYLTGGLPHLLGQLLRQIGTMPFLFLPISDAPGSQSLRGYIERNSISLLSGCIANPIDPPSNGWLGLSSGRERVRRSGLWNNHHTDGDYSPEFMNVFA